MNPVPYLRPLLGQGRPIWAMGAYDVLSAKVVEQAGFDAVGVQSLQLAMANGVPDIGIIGPEEIVRVCPRNIRRAVDIPIVVDFEQGFGEPSVAVYWMKELEAAGVAAGWHGTDYGLPYKCPFIPPHVLGLEDVDETADKIRAMVGEKTNPDFMVIARPHACVAKKDETEEELRADWLMRARAYSDAGADALFAVSWSVEQARWFHAQVEGPLMTIRTPRHRHERSPCPVRLRDHGPLDRRALRARLRDVHRADHAHRRRGERHGRRRRARARDRPVELRGGRARQLYDLLERWMSVGEVRRIRTTYVERPAEAGPRPCPARGPAGRARPARVEVTRLEVSELAARFGNRRQDWQRHVVDLQVGAYEGAVDREDRERVFREAFALTTPTALRVLQELAAAYSGRQPRLGHRSATVDAGRARRPGQDTRRRAARIVEPHLARPRAGARPDDGPRAPAREIFAIFPIGFTHPHLALFDIASPRGWVACWPFQVTSSEDAERQEPTLAAIAEADMHERTFASDLNWRLLSFGAGA